MFGTAATASHPQPRSRRCPRRAGRESGPRPTDHLLAHFLSGLAFLLAAGVTATVGTAVGLPRSSWLALHLAFVGGISQLILGAAPFFAGALLAAEASPPVLFRLGILTWNAGALTVAVGYVTSAAAVIAAGAVLLGGGLAVYVARLERMRRRSLQRAPLAIAWYEGAAAALVCAGTIGTLLATGLFAGDGDTVGTHALLAVGGWFGGTIVGTLHTFFPSLTDTRLRWPRLEVIALLGWYPGLGALAAGYFSGSLALVTAGWFVCLVAASALLANVLGCLSQRRSPLRLPAWLVAHGQLFCVLALLWGLIQTLSGNPGGSAVAVPRDAVFALSALAGWIGLTVAGSLLHLLDVLARVRAIRRPGAPSAELGPRTRRRPSTERTRRVLGPLVAAAPVVLLLAWIAQVAPLEPPIQTLLRAALVVCVGATGLAIAERALAAARAAPLRL